MFYGQTRIWEAVDHFTFMGPDIFPNRCGIPPGANLSLLTRVFPFVGYLPPALGTSWAAG